MDDVRFTKWAVSHCELRCRSRRKKMKNYLFHGPRGVKKRFWRGVKNGWKNLSLGTGHTMTFLDPLVTLIRKKPPSIVPNFGPGSPSGAMSVRVSGSCIS